MTQQSNPAPSRATGRGIGWAALAAIVMFLAASASSARAQRVAPSRS